MKKRMNWSSGRPWTVLPFCQEQRPTSDRVQERWEGDGNGPGLSRTVSPACCPRWLAKSWTSRFRSRLRLERLRLYRPERLRLTHQPGHHQLADTDHASDQQSTEDRGDAYPE